MMVKVLSPYGSKQNKGIWRIKKVHLPSKEIFKTDPPPSKKNPRLLIYLIWVPFAWRSANTCVWTIWVRVVQACSCQRKAKKYFFFFLFPFFLSGSFFFNFIARSNFRIRVSGIVLGTQADQMGLITLGWKQRVFLPCGGGDAFHAQPSSQMRPPSHSLANRCVLAGAGTSSL